MAASASRAGTSAAVGPDVSRAGDVTAEAAASPEPPVTDEFEQELTARFGRVTRWWVGEVPGLGVMRLPLP